MDDSHALITLREAAKISRYHQDYLSHLIRVGRLHGQKIGKTWVTTQAEMHRFLGDIAAVPVHDPIESRFRPMSREGWYIALRLIVLVIVRELLAAYCAALTDTLLKRGVQSSGSQ